MFCVSNFLQCQLSSIYNANYYCLYLKLFVGYMGLILRVENSQSGGSRKGFLSSRLMYLLEDLASRNIAVVDLVIPQNTKYMESYCFFYVCNFITFDWVNRF